MHRHGSFLFLIVITSLLHNQNNAEKTLSCYQCNRTQENEECLPQDLKPCTTVSDRCVTSTSKTATNGLRIERKCGLGPCDFEDIGINTKTIKLNKCNRDKPEYFCIYCCKEDGCNKSSSSTIFLSFTTLLFTIIVLVLSIFEKFQPPYISEQIEM